MICWYGSWSGPVCCAGIEEGKSAGCIKSLTTNLQNIYFKSALNRTYNLMIFWYGSCSVQVCGASLEEGKDGSKRRNRITKRKAYEIG